MTMCRTAVVVGIAMAALGLGVSPAFGEGRLAGSHPGVGPTPGYLAGDVAGAPDLTLTADRRTDAFDREAVVPQVASYLDASERGRGPAPVATSTATNSTRTVDWPQLGIGFLLGIGLALCLVLAIRSTRERRLAH